MSDLMLRWTRARAVRLHNACMRVLPASFRRWHGAAMAEAFTAACEEADTTISVVALTLRDCIDVMRTGIGLRARFSTTLGAGRMLERRTSTSKLLRDDAAIAFKSFRRNRAFFGFAALTLALGIGATISVFTALKSVVLDPLPFPAAERVGLAWRVIGSGYMPPTKDQIEALAAQKDVIEDIAQFSATNMMLTGRGDARQLLTAQMSPRLPSLMGLRPVLGRLFDASEYAAAENARVALVSSSFWKTQMAGKASAIHSTITLNGESWTVIGVMPPSAVQPNGSPTSPDLWVPLPKKTFAQPMIRLRPGVSFEDASARMTALVKKDEPARTGIVTPVTMMRAARLADVLKFLMASVMVLLVITCVNVANLLLQRSVKRQHEMAVCSAIGATRARLFRQLLVESLLLSLAGCAGGVLIGAELLAAIRAMRPENLPALALVHMDWKVASFAIAIALLAAVSFGLAPAISGARTAALGALTRAPRRGGGRNARVRSLLVSVEVALSFALLVAALSVAWTIRAMSQQDRGYDADRLVATSVSLPPWRYKSQAERRVVFDRMAATVRAMPGVTSVSVASGNGLPPDPGIYFGDMRVNGKAVNVEGSVVFGFEVDTAYLSTIGQRLVAGRNFNAEDMSGATRATLLSETLAKKLFPAGDALGKRFQFESDTPNVVVGVVADIPILGLAEAQQPVFMYMPMSHLYGAAGFVARGSGGTTPSPDEIAARIRAVEHDALIRTYPGDVVLRTSYARERFTLQLLGLFAALATVLSAIGLFGVTAQSVTSRTQEIGIRMSLGADRSEIRTMILRSGLGYTALGIVGGGILTAVVLRVAGTLVFGLSHPPAAAFVFAGVGIGLISVLAILQPVERAAAVDPARTIMKD